MPIGPENPKNLGRYYALAQIGLEMVLPVVGGLAADEYLGWSPWGIVAGTILGFGGGILHLVTLLNQQDRNDDSGTKP